MYLMGYSNVTGILEWCYYHLGEPKKALMIEGSAAWYGVGNKPVRWAPGLQFSPPTINGSWYWYFNQSKCDHEPQFPFIFMFKEKDDAVMSHLHGGEGSRLEYRSGRYYKYQ